MADMTKLRERTSEFVCGMEDGDPLHAPCVRLATDWQAAYDAQAEQIAMLREALNGILDEILDCSEPSAFEEWYEKGRETLAATEPKE